MSFRCVKIHFLIIKLSNGGFMKSLNFLMYHLGYFLEGFCIVVFLFVCICIYVYICVCIYILVCFRVFFLASLYTIFSTFAICLIQSFTRTNIFGDSWIFIGIYCVSRYCCYLLSCCVEWIIFLLI